MSLTITVSTEQIAEHIKGLPTTEQWDLLEQVMCESSPSTVARALEWAGQNGCGFHGHGREADRASECAAIATFLASCYSRHDRGTVEGDAIRAAIKSAVAANDAKDNQA